MIKVLHIFGKMNPGGAEMRTLEVMPLLKEKGIHFDFCTLGDGDGVLDESIRQSGSEVFNCPLSLGMRHFSRNFMQLLNDGRYDVVHGHVYYFSGKILQLAHKVRVPKRIAHFRTLHDGKTVTWKRRIYHAYMKHLINRHATDILAVCRGVMESSWKNWQTDSRCRVIYNGINTDRFNNLPDIRVSLCNELGLNPDNKILINVGSFQVAKAHDILLKAMKQILSQGRDVHLLLAGEGQLKEQMLQKAALLKIDPYVHFLGLRSDVPQLLTAADCFVLSSRREGLPGVVLEAVAAGLPVVATDLPGVQEIAEHTEQIEKVPLEDSFAMAHAVLSLLDKKKKRGKGRFPDIFKLQNCVDQFAKIYQY